MPVIADFTIDNRNALSAMNELNTAQQNVTKGIVGAQDQLQSAYERVARILVTVNDKSRNSMEALTRSIERQAAAYGQSGTDKLIAQKELMIKRLGDEKDLIDRVSKSYDAMIRKAGEGDGSQFKQFGGNLKTFVENPLQSAKDMLSGFLEKMGPVGAVVGGTVATLGAVATVSYAAAKSLGEYGLSIHEVQLRTGLTAKEVAQFSFAAKVAGQDVSIFERMMRGLSQAADDTSTEGEKARKTLDEIGVSLRDTHGVMKPTAQVMAEIAAGLGQLPAGFERDKAALDLFKKSGIEAIPVIVSLTDNLKRAQEQGINGPSDDQMRQWDALHVKIVEIETRVSRFTRSLKELAATPIILVLKLVDSSGREISFEDAKKKGYNVGARGTPATTEESYKGLGLTPPGYLANNRADKIIGELTGGGAREAGDEAVRQFAAARGVQAQLKQAEEALRKLKEPTLGSSSVDEVNRYANAEKRIEDLKEQVKQLEKQKSLARQLPEVRKQREKDLAVTQAEAGQDDQSALTKAMREAAKKQAELAGRAQEDLKYHDAVLNAINQRVIAQQKLNDAEKIGEERRKQDLEYVKAEAGLREHLAQQAVKKTNAIYEPVIQAELRRATADTKITDIQLGADREGILRGASHVMRLSELQSGSEQEAITKAYQIRMGLAQQLYSLDVARANKEADADEKRVLMAKAQADLQKQVQDARLEREVKIAEVQRQEFDKIKNEAEGLFHTLFTDPKSFGKQFTTTVRDAALKPIESALATAVAGPIQKLFGTSNKPIGDRSNPSYTYIINQPGEGAAGAPGMTPGILLPWGGSVPAPGMGLGSGGFTTGGNYSGPEWAAYNAGVGTPPFVEDSGASTGAPAGRSGGGFNPAGIVGVFGGSTNAKGIARLAGIFGKGGASDSSLNDWGLARIPGSQGDWANAHIGAPDGIKGVLGSKNAASAELALGIPLSMAGLTGSRRGTAGGVAESTFGGALTGAGIGTMFMPGIGTAIGAGVGAAIGLGASIGEKIAGVETQDRQAQRLVKQLYNVHIDLRLAAQIASIANSKYAGHVSMAVRDPEVRQMLQLYAAGSNQSMPASMGVPRSAGLVEQGGKLYQDPSYLYGKAYAYGSNLPVAGGQPSGTWPGGNQPLTLSVNVNGRGAADFMTGNVITPDFVQSQWSNAQYASNGRRTNAATLNSAGLILG